MNVATREKRKCHDPGFTSRTAKGIFKADDRCLHHKRKMPPLLHLRPQMSGQSHQGGRRPGQGGGSGASPAARASGSATRRRRRSAIPLSVVKELFWKTRRVIACLAPSFPGSFPAGQTRPDHFRLSRASGFTEVIEGRVRSGPGGEDACPMGYARKSKRLYISSPCPASILYMQKVFSFPGAESLANRFSYGRHGPGQSSGLSARGQGRLYRTLNRQ